MHSGIVACVEELQVKDQWIGIQFNKTIECNASTPQRIVGIAETISKHVR